MKAIGYKKNLPVDAPDALVAFDMPKPSAQGRNLLVKVEAVSVNPVDTKVRRGIPPDGDSYKVLGWDAAGVVEAVGDEVTLFAPGDKVWYAGAIDRPGSNAEYQLVDERIVSRMPKSLSFPQAAAMPLTSITAWEMLFDRFGCQPAATGTLLVIGGAGGVGSMMIQLAKSLTELTIIATASRPETREWVTELGADHVIDHHGSMVDQLAQKGINGVNYVASLTNTADHLATIADLIAPQGKLGVIDDPDQLDIKPFKRKSVSVHWEFMFTRPVFQTEDMIEQHKLLAKVADLVDTFSLKSTLAAEFGAINAANLVRAHALLESGKSKGKIVLAGFE